MTYSGNAFFDAAAAAADAARQAAYASLQAPAAAPAWSGATTYAAGAFVSSGGIIYRSLSSGNTNNPPASSPAQWLAMTFAAVQAGMRAADIQFHQTVVAAGRQFNVVTPSSNAALIELQG